MPWGNGFRVRIDGEEERFELPGGDGPQQLTNEMRAVLWQLFTGSKSAKNNPYSERVGSQVIAEREKTKQED